MKLHYTIMITKNGYQTFEDTLKPVTTIILILIKQGHQSFTARAFHISIKSAYDINTAH